MLEKVQYVTSIGIYKIYMSYVPLFQFKYPMATDIKGVPFLQDVGEGQVCQSVGIYKADMSYVPFVSV